jgi:hypothetical protein
MKVQQHASFPQHDYRRELTRSLAAGGRQTPASARACAAVHPSVS